MLAGWHYALRQSGLSARLPKTFSGLLYSFALAAFRDHSTREVRIQRIIRTIFLKYLIVKDLLLSVVLDSISQLVDHPIGAPFGVSKFTLGFQAHGTGRIHFGGAFPGPGGPL